MIGKKIWAFADCYPPGWSSNTIPEMQSHEAICILNATDQQAIVKVTLYFTDKEPMGPFEISVASKRTKHANLAKFSDEIKPTMEYSLVAESNVPVVIQYTRLDSRQAENALMTTMGFSVDA